jgi:transcriptional regulator with XRE-family HTH domain
MPRTALTGIRIRERRLAQGMRQAVLAQQVGISAAYLNLIEHNKRRIGGKLLLNIARALDVDPSALSAGAEEGLRDALQAAAHSAPEAASELAEIDQFAGRFPGWAKLIADQQSRLTMLERRLSQLSDRLAHDPFLSDTLHEVLSTITSVRSTSSILANTPDIEDAWRRRFHNNIYEDSARLAATAQSLVSYFDALGQEEHSFAAPQEALDAFLEAQDYHIAALEGPGAQPSQIVARAPQLHTPMTRPLAEQVLGRYAVDARALPMDQLIQATRAHGYNPMGLAQGLGQPLPLVLRRMAALPVQDDLPRFGLVECDVSGALTFRKPLGVFTVPHMGAACALWPLFQALTRPMVPLVQAVEIKAGKPLTCIAIAQHSMAPAAHIPPSLTATMLIAERGVIHSPDPALPLGPTCRLCTRNDCSARREVSILQAGFDSDEKPLNTA